ncbi:hypothetical protein ACFQ88_33195 [Paenibacillus sp. NPDC056579]|nr:hypothetical protein [Paenibacillus sp. H1-7]
MPTMIGIAFAAVFVAVRWINFHTSQKQAVKPQAIDAELMNALNQGERHE